MLEKGTYGRERKREAYAVATKRERGQLQIEIGLLRRYIDILISEMRGHMMLVPPAPHISSRDPHIHRHESEYVYTCMKYAHVELEHVCAYACMRMHALWFPWSLFSKNIFI